MLVYVMLTCYLQLTLIKHFSLYLYKVTLLHRRSFTLVSYNILADVHAFKDCANAPWMTPGLDEWKMAHRHERFMSELAYLDADVICLQEVGTDYFHTTLLPALRGYVNRSLALLGLYEL